MDLTGKRVLVTGGAGFIGSHLVDRLLADRDVLEVRVLDNLVNGREDNISALGRDSRVSLLRRDIVDAEAADRSCQHIDVVFHLACLGVRHSLHSPLENHRVNAEGTLNVLLAAQRSSVLRFLYVSSSEVFGTAQYVPIDEAHPTWPETVYGAGKLAGEAYARALFRSKGVPTVVVRPFNTYGPRSHFEGDSGEVIPRSIVRVLCGLPPIVFGDGEQTRDFLHVSDTARALVALAESDSAVGETVNIGSGTEASINEVCRLIAESAGSAELAPQYQASRPGDVDRLLADSTKAEGLMGFRPRISLETGIEELVEWFRRRYEAPAELLAQMTDRNWERPPNLQRLG